MTATQQTQATTWKIDSVHSFAEFAVKHMMVATAKGRFSKLQGTIQIDLANPAAAAVEATIDMASVDTGQEMRDNHLRNDDFFNAEQYPTATFRSTQVELVDDGNAKVYGDLTIRGVTKEVVFAVEYEGQGKDARGMERIGFTAETAIDRLDYGIKYNSVLETGGVALSNRVKLTIHISAVAQA